MAGRKNEWTKNCKNAKLTIRKNPKRKNVKTKKYTTKKRGTKNHATKECGTKICGRKNLRRKLAGRKSVLTRNVCLGYFFVGEASELCVFKYLAKNNCYPQISSCLFPLEMMQILQLKVDCHFWLCPHFGQLPLSRTGPKSEQSTFKCNISFNSTHRTSRSQSTHSQDPCEWFGHDLQVLLVKLEQILHLKVDCSDFCPVRDRGSLPYPNA